MDSLKKITSLKRILMALSLILSFSSMYATDVKIQKAKKYWDSDLVIDSYMQYVNFFLDQDEKSEEDILCAKIGQACCEYFISDNDVVFDRQVQFYLFKNEVLKNEPILDYIIKNTPIEECIRCLLKTDNPIGLRNLIYDE